MRFASVAQPFPNRRSRGRIGEHEQKDVALLNGHGAEIDKEVGGGRIPSEYVPAPTGQIGGIGQPIDEPPQRRRNLLTDERRLNACPCQPMQVVPVRVVEMQGMRERINRPTRWGHGTALFQLHVPLDANASGLRHLLAAQSRSAPATDGRKAESFRAQSLATRAEEIAQCDVWHKFRQFDRS